MRDGGDGRAVKQLVVLASVRVVVVLCNGLATVHALDTLAQLCVLNNAETKAEALCCNCDERLPRVVLLVAAQSSLLFYRLANPVVLYRELPVRTPPSTMTWQGDALSLAHPTGVTVIDANVGHTLFEQETITWGQETGIGARCTFYNHLLAYQPKGKWIPGKPRPASRPQNAQVAEHMGLLCAADEQREAKQKALYVDCSALVLRVLGPVLVAKPISICGGIAARVSWWAGAAGGQEGEGP